MTHLERDLLHIVIKLLEREMADFSKLNQDIAELAAKVDALLAAPNSPPDDQPAVDAADAAVLAIASKLP